MTVKFVVSIAGELLYFDAERQPTQPLEPRSGASGNDKPALKLKPADQHPAESAAWDQALASFSADQRKAAEISEAL